MNKIEYEMSFDDYLTEDGLSKSALMDFAVSPGYYKFRQQYPRKQTDAMVIGSAIDCMLFDGPEAFDSKFACRPDGLNLATKAGKEWKSQQIGLTILPSLHGSRTNIECCVAAIDKAAGSMLSFGTSQTSLFWELNGVQMKGRPDYISDSVIIDLKTTSDVSHRSFLRRCIDLKYHWQATIYTSGYYAIMQKDFPFILIAADPEPPHRVEIYEIPLAVMSLGMDQIESMVAKYVECEATGNWPLNSGQIQTLQYPEWFFKNNE